ncbi:transposase [Colletotrichum scovillei]|nr:transposase [Colletotrichum scovillei]
MKAYAFSEDRGFTKSWQMVLGMYLSRCSQPSDVVSGTWVGHFVLLSFSRGRRSNNSGFHYIWFHTMVSRVSLVDQELCQDSSSVRVGKE